MMRAAAITRGRRRSMVRSKRQPSAMPRTSWATTRSSQGISIAVQAAATVAPTTVGTRNQGLGMRKGVAR